jgi:hypothetical protein
VHLLLVVIRVVDTNAVQEARKVGLGSLHDFAAAVTALAASSATHAALDAPARVRRPVGRLGQGKVAFLALVTRRRDRGRSVAQTLWDRGHGWDGTAKVLAVGRGAFLWARRKRSGGRARRFGYGRRRNEGLVRSYERGVGEGVNANHGLGGGGTRF